MLARKRSETDARQRLRSCRRQSKRGYSAQSRRLLVEPEARGQTWELVL